MAETKPSNSVEGATTADIDEDVPVAAKSAEDRKAAAALSSLDSRVDESAGTKDVDQAAIKKAMERLGGPGATNGAPAKKDDEKKVVKKVVKVDAADVTLLIDELDLTKAKATDLLKSHDGEVLKALKAYINPTAA